MKVYRRKSIRLQGFDYSKPGCYFITLCTQHLECLFGEIIRDEMIASPGGQKVIECWQLIPHHYPNVKLYSFILMPNHVHGILEILENDSVAEKSFQCISKYIINNTKNWNRDQFYDKNN